MRKLFITPLLAGMALLLISTAVCAQPLENENIPSLMSAIRVKGPLDFCGEKVPPQESQIRENLEKEILLSLWNRAQVILWIKRSGRYMPHIEKMLRQYNMPDDLKYVAIVESSLLPHIGSSKGAVGYWQFIPSTGRKYGLRIDKYIDERRNFFTATRAAMSYFQKLHGDFGSWTTAVASYNMGEHGMARRMARQKTGDYYHLYLPLETQRYIYKILAVKLILSDLKKYGFHLSRDDMYQYPPFDRVKISSAAPVPIQSIAEAAGTWFKTVKDMNPEIRGNELVSGTHYVMIPKGKSAGFQKRLATLMQAQQKVEAAREKIVHTVRNGESLSGIAGKYNVSMSDLLRWNRLTRKSTIHPGQRLVIKK